MRFPPRQLLTRLEFELAKHLGNWNKEQMNNQWTFGLYGFVDILPSNSSNGIDNNLEINSKKRRFNI